jgi:hypothetical protein
VLDPNVKDTYTRCQWDTDQFEAGMMQLKKVVSTYYVTPASVSSTREKVPSIVDKPFAHYGAFFLVDSVQSFRMDESSVSGPHDELTRYLNASPEPAGDAMQW